MTTRTLSEIAERCGAIVDGPSHLVDTPITGPGTLDGAAVGEITFLAQSRYRSKLESTSASAAVVSHDLCTDRDDLVLLRCADPNAAFSEVVRLFAPEAPRPAPGVHETAVVGEGVELGADVCVGPLCSIGDGARIGDRTVLTNSVVIGPGVTIGADCTLDAHASVHARAVIGDRCVLHPSSVIGSEGFGFAPTPEGWVKIPQCGTVILEDDVEVGASSTIDRARFGATRIGRGAKLDNLVHVAHNVVIGERALLVAQVGIAGSTRIGSQSVIGGQAGVSGHAEIGPGAQIAAKSGVFGDLEGGREYLGYPARPRREALRSLAHARKVPELLDRLRALEARLAELESGDKTRTPDQEERR